LKCKREWILQVVCEYLLDPHENHDLANAAARLVYVVLAGLEKKDVFQDTVYSSC